MSSGLQYFLSCILAYPGSYGLPPGRTKSILGGYLWVSVKMYCTFSRICLKHSTLGFVDRWESRTRACNFSGLGEKWTARCERTSGDREEGCLPRPYLYAN